MKRIAAFCLALVACISLLAGCKTETAQVENGRTITDGAGRQVEVPEKIQSIVCVGVGALRYTCYMGAQDLVVGVEDYEAKKAISRLYNYVNFDKFENLPVKHEYTLTETEHEGYYAVNPMQVIVTENGVTVTDMPADKIVYNVPKL